MGQSDQLVQPGLISPEVQSGQPTTKVIPLPGHVTITSAYVAGLIWHEMYRLYRERGGDVDVLTEILLDYVAILRKCDRDLDAALSRYRSIIWYWSFWPFGQTELEKPEAFDSQRPCPNVWMIEVLGKEISFTEVTDELFKEKGPTSESAD